MESLQHPAAASHGPAWYGGVIIGVALLHGVIRIYSRTTLLHVARRIEYRIRDDLYARLIELDQPFFTAGRTGDLMSRFANDLTNVRMLAGFGVLNIFNTTILYLAGLSLM
ncbi:MAG TPA: ABC transporter transmembrane domain-containing protein, partial [Desulfurivibrionaceae bacterium]|nr:ABC transporter transmembrane domain-containing protein [Desulfurivibrionaceae bacterium]